jgi:hypothetical protein
MFIRFAAVERYVDGYHWRHWKPSSLTGVLTIASLERKRGIFSVEEAKEIADFFSWLNKNVPCPPFKAKNLSRNSTCWWKKTAVVPIRKVKPLIRVLRNHDFVVCTLFAETLEVIYEDEFQVVALDE